MRSFPWCVSSLLVVAASAHAVEPDFQRDIRPILSNACFKCHGPDGDERKGGKKGSGGLRLDTEEGTRADLGGSVSVVPGHPEKSELIARIVTTDEDDRMPPEKSGKPLTAREVELLKAWVTSGGKFAQHWSYVAPQRVAPPPAAAHPVDAFVLARLQKEGLKPQAEAERTALVRRVALDLTGLPPTLEDVDAFVADTKPGAYERLVDRLLASSAYGEHWGRMWLDLARYADSAGYADDPLRTIWPYRDYVIRSFNANKPFDQFTIEQLAGDLLTNATDEQLTATAFHRNTMTNNEGGTQDEEFRNAAVVDRVNTTMAVWMGTSIACAQCHTHKYDPITNAEYFRLFAFLNNTADADRTDESPVLTLYSDEQKAKRAQLDADIAATETKLTTPTPQVTAGAEQWARAFPATISWQTLTPTALKSQAGQTLTPRPDGTVLVPSTADKDTYTIEVPVPAARKLTGLRLEALPEASLPGNGPGHAGGNFVVTRLRAVMIPDGGTTGPRARFVRIELPGKAKLLQLAEVQVFSGNANIAVKGQATQKSTYAEAVAARAIDGNTAGEYAKGSVSHSGENTDDPWWEVDLGSEQSIDRIVVWNRSEAGERLADFRVVALDAQRQTVWDKAGNPAPPADVAFPLNGGREIQFNDAVADFIQNEFSEDGVLTDVASKDKKKKARGSKKGWAIGGGTGKPHTLTLLATKPVDVPAGAKLVISVEQQSEHAKHTLGNFRLAVTDDAGVRLYAQTPADVVAALSVPEAQRSPAQRSAIVAYYLRDLAPELAAEREKLADLTKQLAAITPVTVPIYRELAGNQRRKTRVQVRGNYLVHGEEVNEGVPAVFPPLPADAPLNRLTLARWLVDANNPLTARVIANRFWETIFGIGLVRTSEEFGAQGDQPSHAELLDWLATELVREKWDVKKFIRMLVTSATYRQSSRVTPELAERDPDNRLLARGPRVRLSAEAVRDEALAVSGLLSRKMFGPSVRPLRPALGLSAAFGGGLDWQTSTGEDLHRRALYTEWRRTSPYPSMAAFDAPSREICTLRRDRSNTPIQALVTMNDPVYVEAAQALARRMVESAKTPAEQLTHGFRRVLARTPSASELKRLLVLHDEALAEFKQDAKRASDLATNPIGPVPAGADVADFAAWTTVAGVLLNLDETLMKR
jgi:Protein of unknown function (DUF1553)/Protein of unknown function (DUF1549)/Planctomycete cytochrome C/F5/8 type C domain